MEMNWLMPLKSLDLKMSEERKKNTIRLYLESVWRDSNKEQPVRGSTVVVWDGNYGDVLTRCVSVNPNRWWAYIDDLFQKEEEVCG